MHGFELWAWVLMPEHFHLVIFPRPGGPAMGTILLSIKQSTAKRALNWARANRPDTLGLFADQSPDGTVTHRFWQRGGGYDRNLYSADEVWEKIDYIHNNPVARRLCRQPEEWMWSSARAHRDQCAGPLSVDRGRMPPRA